MRPRKRHLSALIEREVVPRSPTRKVMPLLFARARFRSLAIRLRGGGSRFSETLCSSKTMEGDDDSKKVTPR